MTTTITIKLSDDDIGCRAWLAEWDGDERAEIESLFGTNVIPTPYTEKKLGLDVVKHISEKNPHCIVRLEA